ncbi:hypothetical protein MMC28_002329 [Mycoblastus sanguinarius]|nr:hypothetical protein [Mycoblastus sanguinarius]
MSPLNTYIVTFNCGRQRINPPVFAAHLFSAIPNPQIAPDILVLCLQEIAPIAYSFLGGSYLVPYLSAFRHAITIAGVSLDSASYVNIITRNIGMTAIMIFVLRDQTAQVRWLETAGVGVGMYEMGNKGAVGVRMGYSIGDSTLELSLVSAHLAPMEDALERRNEDWKNIVRGLVFTPVSPTAVRKITTQRLPRGSSDDTEPLLSFKPEGDSIPPMSGLFTPTTHLLFAGDLNYRTSLTKPAPTSHLIFPQPTKDTSNPLHYSHLLPSDQLTRELRAGRTMHGLQEAPINFPPTYKYSEKACSLADSNIDCADRNGEQWAWAKHRWASWCDRVLYLDTPAWMKAKDPAAKVKVTGYTALPLMATSDHRPVACSLSIPAKAIPEPGEEDEEDAKGDVRLVPPFEIDLLWREKRQAARSKEIVVGLAAYLSLTWEGRGILFAILIGAVGGWWVVRNILG